MHVLVDAADKHKVPKSLIRVAQRGGKFKPAIINKAQYIKDMHTFFETVKEKHTLWYRHHYRRDAKAASRVLKPFFDDLDRIRLEHYTDKHKLAPRRKPNISRADLHTIKHMHTQHSEYVLRMLDKNLGTGILLRQTWNDSVRSALRKSDVFERVEIQTDIKQFESDAVGLAIDEFDSMMCPKREALWIFMRDHSKARSKMKTEWAHIGHFSGLLKFHKGMNADGTWPVRIVSAHNRSVIRPIGLAAAAWRWLRYTLETENKITVLPDLTDLIVGLKHTNKRIADLIATPNSICNDFSKIKIVTVDMKAMYPSTDTDKVYTNLDEAADRLKLGKKFVKFLKRTNQFVKDNSYFKVGDEVWRQTKGEIIGTIEGGDVCDTTYYIDELRDIDDGEASIIAQPCWLYFGRYRDDIIIVWVDLDEVLTQQYVDDNPESNQVIKCLRAIYGDGLTFTIDVTAIDESTPFLDVTLTLSSSTQSIRHCTYEKPDNAHELTRECSNVPRHTLKGIVCGITRRYIIANDCKDEFGIARARLYRRLTNLGWPWRDIARVQGVPAYVNRDQIISDYVEGQRQQRRLYADTYANLEFPCIKKQTFNANEIIARKPGYQLCHDDLKTLAERINQSRNHTLPERIWRSTNLIIANRHVPKTLAHFAKNGL